MRSQEAVEKVASALDRVGVTAHVHYDPYSMMVIIKFLLRGTWITKKLNYEDIHKPGYVEMVATEIEILSVINNEEE